VTCAYWNCWLLNYYLFGNKVSLILLYENTVPSLRLIQCYLLLFYYIEIINGWDWSLQTIHISCFTNCRNQSLFVNFLFIRCGSIYTNDNYICFYQCTIHIVSELNVFCFILWFLNIIYTNSVSLLCSMCQDLAQRMGIPHYSIFR
jgi:hypothetical protein